MYPGRTIIAPGNDAETDCSPRPFEDSNLEGESGVALSADTWINLLTPSSAHILAILSAPSLWTWQLNGIRLIPDHRKSSLFGNLDR
jgi:hypothetical protein